MKKTVENDKDLVAYCGLYCAACNKYQRGACPGCHGNDKASWCRIRSCNMEHNYATCADCKTYPDPQDCKDFNNFMSRIFGFIFRSNRAACIGQIKELGLDGYANMMTESGRMSLKR